jgi:hypothetical protein
MTNLPHSRARIRRRKKKRRGQKCGAIPKGCHLVAIASQRGDASRIAACTVRVAAPCGSGWANPCPGVFFATTPARPRSANDDRRAPSRMGLPRRRPTRRISRVETRSRCRACPRRRFASRSNTTSLARAPDAGGAAGLATISLDAPGRSRRCQWPKAGAPEVAAKCPEGGRGEVPGRRRGRRAHELAQDRENRSARPSRAWRALAGASRQAPPGGRAAPASSGSLRAARDAARIEALLPSDLTPRTWARPSASRTSVQNATEFPQ